MSRSFSPVNTLACLFLVMVAGCGDFNANMPVGGVVSDEWTARQLAAGENQQQVDNAQDRPQAANDVDRSGSDAQQQPERKLRPPADHENERQAPRRELIPHDTVRWGKDRPMPSDSMPGKTERWGNERSKPSDNMPSQTKEWGRERSMPSDSMPSRSPLRPPLPSETEDH